MKRTLILAFALVVGLTQLANAASVVLALEAGDTPSPGATITLEVRVTVAPADGTDTSLFGALVYPTSNIGPVAPGSQTPLPGTTFASGTLACNTLRCVVFSQTAGLAGPQSANQTNFLIASQNYTISAGAPIGAVLSWFWQSTPSTAQVDFFNFNNASAPVPALRITVVPEPTTAAMLGLGVLGLAVAGRRRV